MSCLDSDVKADGIHAPLPYDSMEPHVRKMRDFYAKKPGAPLYQKEFGFYCREEWYSQGLDRDADVSEEFGYDPPAHHGLGELGWCVAHLCPWFEEKVIEKKGRHEVVQDRAGRQLLCFAGRRNGFMPEYIDHPVKDMKTWKENIEWRMDPETPERYTGFDIKTEQARQAARRGEIISQRLIGGYMYLRSLIGPEQLFYAFYDMPDVIHTCMETWMKLADAIIARHQEHVTLDEMFFAEDICYNHGPLISVEMMKEFLFPYYQQIIANAKQRQIDASRHLFVQVDTDGYADPVIGPYCEAVGMDVMSPFEVASGCDVVRAGQTFPELRMSGGIDKRVLAQSKKDIDRMVERIIRAMRQRGGYIPTCDHGVPAEVPLTNYRHYRSRVIELSE